MPKQDLAISNPDDFEKFVALKFKDLGYEVNMPPANTKGYDIELIKGHETIAVQVKNHKSKCNVAQVSKFQAFLDLPIAAKFSSGWFISSSGFSKPTITHVETETPDNLRLGTMLENRVIWDYPYDEQSSVKERADEEISQLTYFGVFTCKGGVGKTTVAAHLAGAFALMGYDVILLDLDPDRNLRKLFLQDPEDEHGDASLYVPPRRKDEIGTTITVLDHNQWIEADYPDVKIVICDCSPVLNENPRSLIKKFNYCVIPTTLNPLGVSKNGDVIIRTFKHIREQNNQAEMFALVNNFNSGKDYEKRNEVLLTHLEKCLDKYMSIDSKCKFINPESAKIRSSRALQYWGYHIVEGSKPQLGFQESGGRSYPRTDFLQLADYLERHTDIDDQNSGE